MNPFGNVKNLVRPEEAIENYIGEQFLEWLLETMTTQAQNWPELMQYRQMQVRIEKIRKFLLQRFLAYEAFFGSKEGDPGFLGFAIANLSESPDPLAENALGILEQRRVELAASKHHDLWLKLLKELEVPAEDVDKLEAKEATRNYIAEASDIYSNGEWQTAMGAFLAHERTIPIEYSAITEMLKKNTPLTNSAMEVFSSHAGVEPKYVINTSHMLEKIMIDPESKQLVWDGVVKQMSARKDFYSSLNKNLFA